MPMTVPSNPSRGAADAIVPSATKCFSSEWATSRPAISMLERKSASLMVGWAKSVCQPLAKTLPKAECSRNWAVTSALGNDFCEAVMACSNKPSGAINCLRRLNKRSMTRAKATTEQASSGHIGQPAACMIDSNAKLQLNRAVLIISHNEFA